MNWLHFYISFQLHSSLLATKYLSYISPLNFSILGKKHAPKYQWLTSLHTTRCPVLLRFLDLSKPCIQLSYGAYHKQAIPIHFPKFIYMYVILKIVFQEHATYHNRCSLGIAIINKILYRSKLFFNRRDYTRTMLYFTSSIINSN